MRNVLSLRNQLLPAEKSLPLVPPLPLGNKPHVNALLTPWRNVSGGLPAVLREHFLGLLAVVLLVGIVVGSPNFYPQSHPQADPFAGDFLQEWIGGQMLRHGDRTRFYDPEYARDWEHRTDLVGLQWDEQRYFPMAYPPYYYRALQPLSYLPFRLAAGVWLLLMIAAGGVAWWLVRSAAIGKYLSPGWLPLALFFPPLIESITSCQKGTLLLSIFTATWFCWSRGAEFRAGLVFGCLAFKPPFVIPLLFLSLLAQRWRFVGGTMLTLLTILSASALIDGDLCLQYATFAQRGMQYIETGGYELSKSHNWYGFFTLLVGQGEPTTLAKCFTCLAMATCFVLGVSLFRRGWQPGQALFDWQFSAALIITILVAPHFYTYDLTILLLPCGLIAARVAEGSLARERLLPTAAMLIFCILGVTPAITRATGMPCSVPLMVLLLYALERETRSTWQATAISAAHA
jgi:hypothetical protein